MINVYPIIFNLCDKQCIRDHIEKYGYVAVNVLTATDIDNIKTKFNSWYFGLSDKINTDSWNTMPDQIIGIIKGYKVGHADFLWDLRHNLCINYIFQLLYNSKEKMIPTVVVTILLSLEIVKHPCGRI